MTSRITLSFCSHPDPVRNVCKSIIIVPICTYLYNLYEWVFYLLSEELLYVKEIDEIQKKEKENCLKNVTIMLGLVISGKSCTFASSSLNDQVMYWHPRYGFFWKDGWLLNKAMCIYEPGLSAV